MEAICPQDPSFLFERSLAGSIDDERRYGSQDIGPTDQLPPDLLEAEIDLFFGLSPLTSPCTSPSPSRSASPTSHVRKLAPLSAPPASATDKPAPKAQNSKQKRDKERGRLNRKRKRKSHQEKRRAEPYQVNDRAVDKYVRPAQASKYSFDAKTFPTASSGYISLPDEGGRIYGLKELVEVQGFKLERWDGKTSRPIVDTSSRIIAILAGCPSGPTWDSAHRSALEAIQTCGERCHFPPKARRHRRGNFPALSWGISYGGGQKQPGNLYYDDPNAQALSALTADENLSRIAGNASASFAAWAPRLYTHYENNLEALLAHDPTLRRNWPHSVWASYAVNFGPKTVCRRHRDFANLPFGWCSITALGDFDPTQGGHLILWGLKIIVEFPPGATIIIPSAAIAHSNTPIRRDEVRCSFTQYSAGGLFRWVEQGFQPTGDYMESLTEEGLERELERQAQRCAFGLSLFSTLDSLSVDQTARNEIARSRYVD